MTNKIIIFAAALIVTACEQTRPLDDTSARDILESSLSDTTDVLSNTELLIDDEETAIDFAEVILFKVYGKRQIQNEKPYNVKNLDGYWIVTGTVHAQLGGAFEIVFSSKDGQIVRSTHYK